MKLVYAVVAAPEAHGLEKLDLGNNVLGRLEVLPFVDRAHRGRVHLEDAEELLDRTLVLSSVGGELEIFQLVDLFPRYGDGLVAAGLGNLRGANDDNKERSDE